MKYINKETGLLLIRDGLTDENERNTVSVVIGHHSFIVDIWCCLAGEFVADRQSSSNDELTAAKVSVSAGSISVLLWVKHGARSPT